MTIPEVVGEHLGGFTPFEGVTIRVDGVRTVATGVLPGNLEVAPTQTLVDLLSATLGNLDAGYAGVTGMQILPSAEGSAAATNIDPAVASDKLFVECELTDARTMTAAEKSASGRWLKIIARASTYVPGTRVYLVAESDRLIVGMAIVGADGTASLDGAVPLSALGAGAHRFRIVGSRTIADVVANEQGVITLSDSAMESVRTFDNATTAVVRMIAPQKMLVRYIPLRESAPWWLLVLIVLLTALGIRERRIAYRDPRATRRALRLRLARRVWAGPLLLAIIISLIGYAFLYFELMVPALLIGLLGFYMVRTSPLNLDEGGSARTPTRGRLTA
jgi:hypothetical protein